MSEKIEPAHISKVHLKGYKSIRDVEINLFPGLNILIGPNGSGKTNFLEFLRHLSQFQFWKLEKEFSASIHFSNNNKTFQHHFSSKIIKQANGERGMSEFKESFKIDGENIASKRRNVFDEEKNSGTNFYRNWRDNLHPIVLLSYEIPKNILGLDSILNLEYKISGIEKNDHFFQIQNIGSNSRFIDWFFFVRIAERLEKAFSKKKIKSIDDLNEEELTEIWSLEINFIEILKSYTPISNFRLSKGFSFNQNENFLNVNFLRFEFLVNGKWLFWKQLSDGTKRIFYLISEMFFWNKGVYLIDEPELGIHPHQLHLLMNFLKIQSRYKQIIITTHAPQVINHLKKEELNRLIISRYEDEKGTKLSRLGREEKQGMIDGLTKDGLDFSDYWVNIGIDAENIQ